MQNISFDSLPSIITEILTKVNNIEQIISKSPENSSVQLPVDRWLSIEELIEYLPGHPSKSTVYAKTQQREIPHKKFGRRLVFLQSEIDSYLKLSHRKTTSEIALEADDFIQKRKKS